MKNLCLRSLDNETAADVHSDAEARSHAYDRDQYRDAVIEALAIALNEEFTYGVWCDSTYVEPTPDSACGTIIVNPDNRTQCELESRTTRFTFVTGDTYDDLTGVDKRTGVCTSYDVDTLLRHFRLVEETYSL